MLFARLTVSVKKGIMHKHGFKHNLLLKVNTFL